MTSARDITERKQAEAELERRVSDRAAELAAANAALVRMLGCADFEELASRNLEENSDAMPDGARLEMRSGVTAGNEVFVEVADTGAGIPEAIRGRIFEPFFTTKGAEKGGGQRGPRAPGRIADSPAPLSRPGL